MLNPPVPFYFDWTFWSATVALIAIVLSQLPPIYILLRPKRLDVEVYSRIRITHKVGNPNASLVVSIRNTGGRELRITALRLIMARDGKSLITLPASSYFELPSSTTSVLFVPFSLKPNETWAHTVAFLNDFDRLTEKQFRGDLSALTRDIRQKLNSRSPEKNNVVVVAEPNLVQPFKILFDRLFVWEPGEYVAELQVEVKPGSASYNKKYRFTLYESDTAELRQHVDDYSTGGGLAYTVDQHGGIHVPLSEHVN